MILRSFFKYLSQFVIDDLKSARFIAFRHRSNIFLIDELTFHPFTSDNRL